MTQDADGLHDRWQQVRRAALLRALGLDPALARAIGTRPLVCECGHPAAAIGVFWNCGPEGMSTRYRNAMYLCPVCAAAVDRGVRIVRLGASWRTTMPGLVDKERNHG